MRTDSSDSRQKWVPVYREYGNEPSDSTKCSKFVEQLTDIQLIKNAPAASS
jgi:hypothetical protein